MNDRSKYYNKYYHKLIRYDIDDSYQYERLEDELEHSIFVYSCYVRISHTETIKYDTVQQRPEQIKLQSYHRLCIK